MEKTTSKTVAFIYYAKGKQFITPCYAKAKNRSYMKGEITGIEIVISYKKSIDL